MTRLLFVSHTSDWTGPTNSLSLILEGLRDDYEISVLVPGRGEFTSVVDRLGIASHSIGPITKWKLPALVSLLCRLRPDVVYANNTHGSSRLAYLAARAAGACFIVHVRGMMWDKSWARLWYLNRADAVVAVSTATGNSVSRFVHPDRLTVVHNGVPLRGDLRIEDSDPEGGLASDEITLLYLAHICLRKGQLDAVRGFHLAGEPLQHARLLLVGSLDREPAYSDKVRRLIGDLGLEDRVSLLGFRSDVDSLLRHADIYVHTAHADPHPRAVIEAMAAGLPVAAYAADGVTETVVDGKTGFLVQPGEIEVLADRLARLAASAELRQAMGTAGRVRATNAFSAETTTRGVRSVIDKVASIRNGGTS